MTSIDDALDLNCRNVIQRMGNRTTTSTSELQRYGDTYFPAGFFTGVYPADRAPQFLKLQSVPRNNLEIHFFVSCATQTVSHRNALVATSNGSVRLRVCSDSMADVYG